MAQRPFRFLHAADLHLERPCQTSAEVPDHLVDLLIDAPLRAATKVFDAAIDQRVDFVVLAGDIINPAESSPRELLFLAEQFQRLADRNVTFYWAGGVIDSLDQWPGYVSWPSNMLRFPRGRVQCLRHEIAGSVVCEIIGCSHDPAEPPRPYQFTPSGTELFSIAVAHAEWNASALGEIGVNYWALGGPHQRSTPLETNCVAHFAGSPQGRTASEAGPHGCTLVTVDEQRRVQLASQPTDVLRWLTPRLSLPESADRHELERLLHQRTEQLQAESPGMPLFVTWNVACAGSLRFALRHSSLATELLAELRQEFGHLPTPVWTFAIDAELPNQLPPEWQTEESLRGDFLRAAQRSSPEFWSDHAAPQLSEQQSTAHDLNDLAPPLILPAPENLEELAVLGNLPSTAADALLPWPPADPEVRRQTLREVAWLAADLLSPAEAGR